MELDWLPHHKCGLSLTHNEHRNFYESAAEFYRPEDFPPGQWEEAIRTDSVWVLQWYPDTPIGSYTVCAATLSALQAAIEKEFPR